MQVREISCGKMHELAIALDKAGFDSSLVQKIISSKNNTLAKAMYEAIAEKKVVEIKFSLLVDLGTIVVPDDYIEGKEFASLNQKDFYYFNENLTDENFSNLKRVLKSGDKFRVKVFKQNVSGSTTSQERLDFLESQNAVLLGAQGASLIYKQKRYELPKGYWYASFDKKDNLWKGSDGYHRVPGVDARSVGDFGFNLGSFEDGWDDDDVLLCFCDEA